MAWVYHYLAFPDKQEWDAARAMFAEGDGFSYPEGAQVAYEAPKVFDEVIQDEWQVTVCCNGVGMPETWKPFEVFPKNPKNRMFI